MIKNYFKIFVFLFFLNSVSQNIETVEVKKDQKISSFISDYEISASDFFILNSNYTSSRFNHSELDLDQKISTGDLVKVFKISKNNDLEDISFISHKIKRRQNLAQISSIYGVSESLILKYNDGVEISKNNILKIPRIIKSNLSKENRLKSYVVKPKEGNGGLLINME